MRDSRTRALLAGASPVQPQPTSVYRLAPSGPAPTCSKVSLPAAALSPTAPWHPALRQSVIIQQSRNGRGADQRGA